TKVQRYLVGCGMLDIFPRWRAQDREEIAPGTGVPATSARSTVRLLQLVPRELAAKLSLEEIASLAAPQLPKPKLDPLPAPAGDADGTGDAPTDGAGDAPTDSPQEAPPPLLREPYKPEPSGQLGQRAARTPKRMTLEQAAAKFKLPELPAGVDFAPLMRPLETLNRHLSTPIPLAFAARCALAVELENWHEAGRAITELAMQAKAEAIAAQVEGMNPIPWNVRRSVKALLSFFANKLAWITEGAGALRARQRAAVLSAEALARAAAHSPAARQ